MNGKTFAKVGLLCLGFGIIFSIFAAGFVLGFCGRNIACGNAAQPSIGYPLLGLSVVVFVVGIVMLWFSVRRISIVQKSTP